MYVTVYPEAGLWTGGKTWGQRLSLPPPPIEGPMRAFASIEGLVVWGGVKLETLWNNKAQNQLCLLTAHGLTTTKQTKPRPVASVGEGGKKKIGYKTRLYVFGRSRHTITLKKMLDYGKPPQYVSYASLLVYYIVPYLSLDTGIYSN